MNKKAFLVLFGTMLLLLFAATGALAANPLTYFIGNSVTDTINYTSFENMVKGQGHTDYDWGRHMIPGAPLQWIWDHPADGFNEAPYGYYPQALPGYPFNVLSLQPYDRDVASDVDYGGRFFDKALQGNTNVQVYIYTCWPRRDWNGWGSNWEGQYLGSSGVITSKAFHEAVADGITANHPGRKRVWIMGHSMVMYALNQKIKAGQVPGMSSIWDLYADGVHLNGNGSFLVAATAYCTIFKMDPRNLPTTGYSVSSTTIADIIKQTVWEVIPNYAYSGYSGASPSPLPTPTATVTSSTAPTPTPTAANAIVTYDSWGVTIDGNVDTAWSQPASYSIARVISGTVSSDTDLSGTWKALWDNTKLYYMVEMTDDSKKNDSTNSWDDDSVEIYIDPDNSHYTYYDNDYQLVFRWNDTAIHLGTNSKTNTTGITFAFANTTNGYRLEVGIPWSTLGVTPGVGKRIGTDVHVNDDDDGSARDGKKAWFATADNSWSNPSTFGLGDLGAGTGTSPTPTPTVIITPTATVTPTITPTPSVAASPTSSSSVNLVSNPGFESGVLTPWTGGTIYQNHIRHAGSWAAFVDHDKPQCQQTISGLSPNTTYKLSGWMYIDGTSGEDDMTMGATGYGSSTSIDLLVSEGRNVWKYKELTFTTGSSNTSVTIYFKKKSTNGWNWGWGDDFELKRQ